MKKNSVLAVFAALAVLCASAASAAGEFSAFSAKSLDGTEVNQSVWGQARLSVVNVWGTFCGPCIREMPDLGRLAEEYRGKGVQFVGIVIDTLDRRGRIDPKQVEKARALVAQTNAAYLHLLPSPDLMEAKLSSVYAIPQTYFVDASGKIVDSVTGAMSADDWRAKIDSVAAGLK